jgi:hypothetical protein
MTRMRTARRRGVRGAVLMMLASACAPPASPSSRALATDERSAGHRRGTDERALAPTAEASYPRRMPFTYPQFNEPTWSTRFDSYDQIGRAHV